MKQKFRLDLSDYIKANFKVHNRKIPKPPLFHTRDECKNWTRRELIEGTFFPQPALMDTKDYEDENGEMYRNIYIYDSFVNGQFQILGRLYYA